jgi:hypothetical protein
MLAQHVQINMTITNRINDRVTLEAINSALGKDALLMGEPCASVSLQVVPNAFLGSEGHYQLVPGQISWVCDDPEGTLIEGFLPFATMNINGSVTYITTKSIFKTRTTQTLSLDFDHYAHGIRFCVTNSSHRMVGLEWVVDCLCIIERWGVDANKGDDSKHDFVIRRATQETLDLVKPELDTSNPPVKKEM